MKKALFVISLLLAFSQNLFCLELKSGKMRLLVDEKNGRFSVYYLSDATKNKYVSLLYDQEARTSYASINYDGKIYKLGDSSEFKTTVIKKDAAVVIEYRSSFCAVKQNINFITTPGNSLVDGISIDFSIENISGKNASIGLRALFDTWLGEKSTAHFYSSVLGPMNSETFLEADYADIWIRSEEAQDAKDSLQFLLASPATRPDKIIAANWKRLNDSNWSIDKSTSRGFTMLPYSVNDSAVALYFEPQAIRPGAIKDIRMILSAPSNAYSAGIQTALTVSAALIPQTDAPINAISDLVAVRSLLDAIDEALNKAPNEADLSVIRDNLERLEARQRKY